jgi:putative component of membrane protein insertase Oxa1/YidC/SpoIIIJ protein YidD
MKLSPGGLIAPPKIFQHLIRKKGIRVFVDFHKWFIKSLVCRACRFAVAG